MAEGAPESPAGGAIPLSPAAAGGSRKAKSVSVKRVSAKTIRRALKRLGMKPKGPVILKGGVDPAPEVAVGSPGAVQGGSRKTKKAARRRRGRGRGMFGY